MRKLLDGIGYYMSCMVLFNVIYTLSIITRGVIFNKQSGNNNAAGIVTCFIAILLATVGVIATIKILTVDDSKWNIASTGRKFEVLTVEDQTGENYFANFSLIVLTGLTLPTNPNWLIIIIFLLIEVSLGVVYIKKNMFYMNPSLSIMDYSIFKCTGRDATTKEKFDGCYYFVTKGMKISKDMVIEYKNIQSNIIRLNKHI